MAELAKSRRDGLSCAVVRQVSGGEMIQTQMKQFLLVLL